MSNPFSPNTALTSPELSKTVLEKEKNDSKQEKVIDNTLGAVLSKSGQQNGDTFVTSLVSCYANLTYSPILVFFFCLAIVCMISDVLQIDGPLEIFQDALNKTANDESRKSYTRSVASYVMNFENYAISYKTQFINSLFLWIPYAKKPSTKNLWFTLLFQLLLIIALDLEHITVFVLCQAWFLYTELRNPRYKIFVALVSLLLMIVVHVPSVNSGPVPTAAPPIVTTPPPSLTTTLKPLPTPATTKSVPPKPKDIVKIRPAPSKNSKDSIPNISPPDFVPSAFSPKKISNKDSISGKSVENDAPVVPLSELNFYKYDNPVGMRELNTGYELIDDTGAPKVVIPKPIVTQNQKFFSGKVLVNTNDVKWIFPNPSVFESLLFTLEFKNPTLIKAIHPVYGTFFISPSTNYFKEVSKLASVVDVSA